MRGLPLKDDTTAGISFVVPVYNCDAYVEECLNGTLRQTYRHLEITVINDGSTDNTLSVLKKVKESDRRIRLINQKNSGLSSARNKGIDCTRGEYLSFVDSDDFISAAETLLGTMLQNNCDLGFAICKSSVILLFAPLSGLRYALAM